MKRVLLTIVLVVVILAAVSAVVYFATHFNAPKAKTAVTEGKDMGRPAAGSKGQPQPGSDELLKQPQGTM